ncbi:MAG TPA: hypothetical protein VIE91_04815 [Methylophilaceae bacterium]|jgi:Ca2+-binding EF-hand superfamily protein
MTLEPLIIVVLALLSSLAYADQAAAPKEPSVEENIQAMDKDHDGVVTVYEVRAYIEAKHGKGYKKDVLDEMESSANGKSCKTPFSNSIY